MVKVIVTTTANNTSNTIIKLTMYQANHTALNTYITVKNLVFCCADTLSYTRRWYAGCVKFLSTAIYISNIDNNCFIIYMLYLN